MLIEWQLQIDLKFFAIWRVLLLQILHLLQSYILFASLDLKNRVTKMYWFELTWNSIKDWHASDSRRDREKNVILIKLADIFTIGCIHIISNDSFERVISRTKDSTKLPTTTANCRYNNKMGLKHLIHSHGSLIILRMNLCF